ncbi:MAG: Ribosome hibernation promoting factor [Gammaproteobacteria bacterium]|nr:Ribosome hibernation promoting factor [Gammaproteobacteria bacterium]
MQITISGQHMDVTPALREYVNSKMERIERHFDHVSRSNVVLNAETTRHCAEVTVSTKGATLHANAEADDMYAAIDAMIDKLDNQVRKQKGKSTDHHKNGGALKDQFATS